MIRRYNVIALSVPIWFNKWGDHDHNGKLFALRENQDNITAYIAEAGSKPGLLDAQRVSHPFYYLVRPLVLRACVGETIEIEFTNRIRDSQVGMHLVSDGYEVLTSDGAHVGQNSSSLAAYEQTRCYTWHCQHEGVFVFHDAGNLSGMEDGTNLHGLFGALVVEPANTTWRDPVGGVYAQASAEGDPVLNWLGDGLYVDIVPNEVLERQGANVVSTPWLDKPIKYPEGKPGHALPMRKAFREYVIFFHDEVEFATSHERHVVDICHNQPDICGNPPPPEHASHPLMTISYRAEPMVARQQELWHRMAEKLLLAPVVHEEQHHSSWLFGDPATPILKAYIGDPVRIRLVHTGVKETHVFHLHVYSWHHDPSNLLSPLIDAISIGPQTGHTIQPLWGAGNRQGATGDVIWHCHLYPHFHEGMWGMFRTFDCLHEGDEDDTYPDGSLIEALLPLPDRASPPARTAELPGFPNFIEGLKQQRSPLPPWNNENVPLGLDYRRPSLLEVKRLEWLQADPRPWINTKPIPGWMFNAFRLPNEGENINDGILSQEEPNAAGNGPANPVRLRSIRTRLNPGGTLHLAVESHQLQYNDHCWHDPEGHLFRPVDGPLELSSHFPLNVNKRDHRGRHAFVHASCDGVPDGHGHPGNTPGSANLVPEPTNDYLEEHSPLFVRANHGDVVTLELENRLPRVFCLSPFDQALPPCENYSIPVRQEDGYHDHDPNWRADRTPPMPCGQHVHLVKFDPLVCDGASTGWNYLSGPRAPYWDEQENKWRYLRMRYIWWVDEEFGVIFTHDHLFANFRQKRGLFGAMLAEPHEATYHDIKHFDQPTRFGAEAVICYPDEQGQKQYFREFCIGLGDFVPLYNRHKLPLNEPPIPGGHSDHGVVGINYRSAPIRERTLSPHDPTVADPDDPRLDPAYCFSSHVWEDPATPIFCARPGDPIRLRLVQGSHEEQHSFQVHGLRWRRFRQDPSSPLSNQQTIGISEQFSFHIEHHYDAGDYLYKFGTSDDLWMGAWGIIRVGEDAVAPLPPDAALNQQYRLPPFGKAYHGTTLVDTSVQKFRIVAEAREVHYSVRPPLSDPLGLVYRLESEQLASAVPGMPQVVAPVDEPVILRCHVGEWVEVELVNNTRQHPGPEPSAPQVPVERFDRAVSERVSMHADLLRYDVRQHDGCNVGRNPVDLSPTQVENPQDQTAGYSETIVYRWYADVEGAVLLQDFADFRNHRHHGLVGALIVEPADAAITLPMPTITRSHAQVQSGSQAYAELVLIIQDGLRLFHFGNLSLPMGDPPGDLGQAGPDPTDQGQKAFNYRAQPIGKPHWLAGGKPLTYTMAGGQDLRLHLLTAADKPRNHSFTLHGHGWREWPNTKSTHWVGSATSLSSGSALTLEIALSSTPADYAFRSGMLRWALSQGLWGVLRIEGPKRHFARKASVAIAIVGLGLGLLRVYRWAQNRQ